MRAIKIAVDGPAGVGKSSTCKLLAKELGYTHLNSGIFYRLLTYILMGSDIKVKELGDGGQRHLVVVEGGAEIAVTDSYLAGLYEAAEVVYNKERGTFLVGGSYVELQGSKISKLASIYATCEVVRAFVTNEVHKVISSGGSYVVEGRDAASRIVPDASLKIYLDASIRVRALRRLEQLNPELFKGDAREVVKGDEFKRVLGEIAARDRADKSRLIDPLVVHEGSVRVDTSYLNQDEVLELLLTLVKSSRG